MGPRIWNNCQRLYMKSAAQSGTQPRFLPWEQLSFWFLNDWLNTHFVIIHKLALVFGREMDCQLPKVSQKSLSFVKIEIIPKSKIHSLIHNLHDKPDCFKMWIYESGYWKDISSCIIVFLCQTCDFINLYFSKFCGLPVWLGEGAS